jgi:hypothetical protein
VNKLAQGVYQLVPGFEYPEHWCSNDAGASADPMARCYMRTDVVHARSEDDRRKSYILAGGVGTGALIVGAILGVFVGRTLK